jgi:hypothetical protein
MALSSDDVAEIIRRYDRGNGDEVGPLATAYGVSDAAIKYHLKKAGVLAKNGEPKQETETDLGIGEDDAAEAANAQIAAVISDPKFAAIIDAAVTARVAQMSAPQGTVAAPDMAQLMATFTKTIQHVLHVNAVQQPGYIPPLPAEEVDRRAQGFIEMMALLKDYKAKGMPPQYYVGPSLFYAGLQLYAEGDPVATYLPPVEDFTPINEEGAKVHEAMMRYIGGPSQDIAERVSEAQLAAKRALPIAEDAAKATASSGPVEYLTNVPRREPVPETRRQAATGPTEPLMPRMHGARVPSRQPAVVE